MKALYLMMIVVLVGFSSCTKSVKIKFNDNTFAKVEDKQCLYSKGDSLMVVSVAGEWNINQVTNVRKDTVIKVGDYKVFYRKAQVIGLEGRDY